MVRKGSAVAGAGCIARHLDPHRCAVLECEWVVAVAVAGMCLAYQRLALVAGVGGGGCGRAGSAPAVCKCDKLRGSGKVVCQHDHCVGCHVERHGCWLGGVVLLKVGRHVGIQRVSWDLSRAVLTALDSKLVALKRVSLTAVSSPPGWMRTPHGMA